MPNVISDAALTAGLRNTFANTYDPQYQGVQNRLSRIAAIDLPSDKLTELYAYFTSAPHLKMWLRGNGIPTDVFEAIGFNVTNKRFAMKIPWYIDDRADDQIGKVYDRAKQLAQHAVLSVERGIFDVMLNTTNYLDVIQNAPDGAALYSATDGASADRFGVSGGNIITGNGITSVADVRQDFFDALERVQQFQDTKGQPLVDESYTDEVVIFYNVANSEVFREAFVQKLNLGTASGGSAQVAAQVSNLVMDSGLNTTLVPTQRITDNDWFLFFPKVTPKAIFSQRRSAIEDRIWTLQNSDFARDFDIEAYGIKERRAFAAALPISTCKVNN